MPVEVTPTRRAALDTIERVRGGELVDRAIARAAGHMAPREHAWIQELVYGTLRLRGRIDHILAAFVRGGLPSLEPVVLNVLRLGTYQLLEMGSVPPYAAVSQSVELSRLAGAGRAAGLVNGVLQSVRRGAGSVRFPRFEQDPIGYLSAWESHPRWLVERWVERWGAEETRRLTEANNRRPELYLTPIGIETPDAVAALAGAGIEAEPVPGFPGSLHIAPTHRPADALAAVPSVIQDPAAASVVRFANLDAAATAVDLAAAPGGKAVGLAASIDYLAASDLSLGRLGWVRENADRVGLASRIGLVVADGRRPPFRPVDAVLLDAPCTGTGTLRRHPDARWRITEDDLAALTTLQRDLLDAAASVVRPGGVLVYSTCSLEPEENEEQVERFLERHRDFRVDESSGFLSVLPQASGVDGAFAVRLIRSE